MPGEVGALESIDLGIVQGSVSCDYVTLLMVFVFILTGEVTETSSI